MKKTLSLLLLLLLTNLSFAAEPDFVQYTKTAETETEKELDGVKIELPPKDSVEYWNVRTEAIRDLIPFLTRKRAEIRKKQMLMSDYLSLSGQNSNYLIQKSDLPENVKPYLDLISFPEESSKEAELFLDNDPSWDEIVEVVMKHIIFEGYLPSNVEDEEIQMYIDICTKNEDYAKKVHSDLSQAIDQTITMWVFLDRTGELVDFKAYMIDLDLEKKAKRQQRLAQAKEQRREAAFTRAETAKQQKFENMKRRAIFRSQQAEHAWEERQMLLKQRQTMLDAWFLRSHRCYW